MPGRWCLRMTDLIKIDDTEMQIREYNGHRVVTFKDIDTVHQRKSGTAKASFRRNKKYFQEGTDYVVLTRNSIGTLSTIGNIPPKGITLLTESGYLMVVKTFTDDLSWQVQRQLVNAYFKVKQTPIITNAITVRPKYRTSSTPVPKNPSWYCRNQRKMRRICNASGKEMTELIHNVLLRLGEEYDLDAANDIYVNELGFEPEYALDIVNYFPELAELADEYIGNVEKLYK